MKSLEVDDERPDLCLSVEAVGIEATSGEFAYGLRPSRTILRRGSRTSLP